MDTIIIILSLIFFILAWVFVINPILDGLGGFGQNLIKKLTHDDQAAAPGFCQDCGRPRSGVGPYCPHCGAKLEP